MCLVHKGPTFTSNHWLKKERFPREDVMKKLFKTIKVGGTARQEKLLIFSCSLEEKNVE